MGNFYFVAILFDKPKDKILPLKICSDETRTLLRGKWGFTPRKVRLYPEESPSVPKAPKIGPKSKHFEPCEFVLQSKNSQAKL